MGLAARVPALGDHVRGIVERCPHEQMCRPYTRLDIALVENVKSLRDRPIRDLPCDPVRRLRGGAESACTELPVAGRPVRRAPEPACAGLLDLRPETPPQLRVVHVTQPVPAPPRSRISVRSPWPRSWPRRLRGSWARSDRRSSPAPAP